MISAVDRNSTYASHEDCAKMPVACMGNFLVHQLYRANGGDANHGEL